MTRQGARSSRLSRMAVGAVGAVVLTMLAACSGTPPGPQPQADFARAVDVGGGRSIFLECRGQGSPTVVLESGYHDSADLWSLAEVTPPAAGEAVLPGIARFTRVCAYDRPGTLRYAEDVGSVTARSTPVPMPRTAADIVSDLRTLLNAADVPGPYVFVTHSLGGLFSRLYQRTHPEDVEAMVLVDSFAPEVPRLFGNQWPAYRELLSATGTQNDPTAERIDLDASIAQLDAAPPMRPIPLAVISKTEPFGGLPSTLPAGLAGADIERLWPQVQASVVNLHPQTPQTLATGSDHYVQVRQPDLVIADTRLAIGRAAA